MVSESSEPLTGRLGARASEDIAYKPPCGESRCACEWGGWGRLSDGLGQNNPDSSEGRWGGGLTLRGGAISSRLIRHRGSTTRGANDGRKPDFGKRMSKALRYGQPSSRTEENLPN